MTQIFKSYLPKLAVSLFVAMCFMFITQQSYAQSLSTKSKENAKKEVKTEKAKVEKEQRVATEKSTKSMQSTKAEQKEVTVESEESLEAKKKEIESAKKPDDDKKLAEIKKSREEIALRKEHGKLSEKEYQDAVNKLDKMEKELKSNSKPKLDSKGGR